MVGFWFVGLVPGAGTQTDVICERSHGETVDLPDKLRTARGSCRTKPKEALDA